MVRSKKEHLKEVYYKVPSTFSATRDSVCASVIHVCFEIRIDMTCTRNRYRI
eukprot:m.248231 g.248231  ORF g.248231 m.248231 type:complete len:52 (+) comp15411_c0_seq1:417-572(+)